MANHKQALKRHRQNTKRRARNVNVKTRLRSLVKDFRAAVEKKNAKKAKAALETLVPAFDRAAQKGAIPKRQASRMISRLSATCHQL